MNDAVGDEPMNRRAMLKKAAVGASAAGLVWSAPRVEGLSLRPNYAAAASGAVTSVVFDLRFNSTSVTGTLDKPLGNGNVRLATAVTANNDGVFTGGADINVLSFNGGGTANVGSIAGFDPAAWNSAISAATIDMNFAANTPQWPLNIRFNIVCS